MRIGRGVALVVAIGIAACSETPGPTELDGMSDASFRTEVPQTAAGAVYLMTNANGANEVIVYRRALDGSLTYDSNVATGGDGTGDGLGNQEGVVLSDDGRWLLVVNAGSDDVSVFAVEPGGLRLTDVASSGGDRPVSIAIHGDLVYVLNAGSPNSIAGLRLANDGSLTPIAGATRPLSAASTGPAQIGFTPDGDVLVVTEKATNMITTYVVNGAGIASAPQSYAAAGQTPFGYAFNQRGDLIVSEAFGGAADASTVSSYRVFPDGSVQVVSAAVPTTETAACWIAISQNGRYAYSTNGGSGSISGLRIGQDGSLELLDADGVTGSTGPGSTPLDAAFSTGGRYLYVLAFGNQEVGAFSIGADGSLSALPGISGLPATANGMAVR